MNIRFGLDAGPGGTWGEIARFIEELSRHKGSFEEIGLTLIL